MNPGNQMKMPETDLVPFRVVGVRNHFGVLLTVEWAIELSPYSTMYQSMSWMGLS